MKKKTLHAVCTIVMLFTISALSAQVVRISTLSQEGFVMGKMTQNEINSGTAGYVDYGSAAGLEVNYFFKNKLGLGVRWSGTTYGRDIEIYESDLKEMLGISNDRYDITQLYAFWSFGSDIGLSYLLDIARKWQVEPYFYVGLHALISPTTAVIYTQNNTTFQYLSKSQIYFGGRVAPGVKFHWNPFKHAGLYLSLEYAGSAFVYDDERSMISSFNTLEITDTEKNYSIQSVNIGLGLAFRFGKGLEE